MRKKRYWAIRTDKENCELLFKELENGKLRQGWGYHESQDLHKLKAEIDKDSQWKSRLSDDQDDALPNLKMLSDSDDTIQIGDIIFAPNLPKYGMFCLAEVIGEYYFQPLELDEKTNINGLSFDYGHVLPVRLITSDGINKYNENVHSELRSTLCTRMRMWNLDGYSKHIETLISCSRNRVDLHTPSSNEDRLNIAWDKALSKSKEALQKELITQLDSQFHSAEWEKPIREAISKLYPGTHVKKTGGRNEHGADIVIRIPNHFGELPWLVVLQIKDHKGEIGTDALNQIKQAQEYYGKEGRIILGVVFTTAERKSPMFEQAKKKCEEEVNFPIELVLRKKLINIMTEGLSYKFSD